MKNARGVLILLVLFVVVPFGLLALLWKDRCQRTSTASVRSPNGAWIAETTRVDCGPSMKVATEVTLRRGDAGEPESVLVLAEENGLLTAWEGDQKLVLTLPVNAEIVKGKRDWQGVEISVESQTR